jgi:hypothetical protein
MLVWKFSFSAPLGGVCRCMQQFRFCCKGSMNVFIPGAHFKSSVILHDGYVFHKNKYVKKTGTTYFVCRNRDCQGAGVVKQGQEFRQTQTHKLFAAGFATDLLTVRQGNN